MVDIKGLDKEREADSIRAEQKDGEDAAKDAGGEKNELSKEEKMKLVHDTVDKILETLLELPPDVCVTSGLILCEALSGARKAALSSTITEMSKRSMVGPLGRTFPFKGRFG